MSLQKFIASFQMALLKIGRGQNYSIISKFNYAASSFLSDTQFMRESMSRVPEHTKILKTANIHFSGVRNYPETPRLDLPSNVSEIFDNETGRFTPERARDIAAPILLYGSGSANRDNQRRAWSRENSYSKSWRAKDSTATDLHVGSYDCFSTVSLNSSMQSTVPKPFCSTGKSTHLNMPGGQWAVDGKYIAEYMQKSHYVTLKRTLVNSKYDSLSTNSRFHYSTDSTTNVDTKKTNIENDKSSLTTENLSMKGKFRRALKDYGNTVIVFHTLISLMSLGLFYTIVSSGIDVIAMLKFINISNERLENVLAQSSTFLIAYAVHKLFAMVRISITLTTTPFIVRYLRKKGILKEKKS